MRGAAEETGFEISAMGIKEFYCSGAYKKLRDGALNKSPPLTKDIFLRPKASFSYLTRMSKNGTGS